MHLAHSQSLTVYCFSEFFSSHNAGGKTNLTTFMHSSCLAFHSAFIIAFVYQHGDGWTFWRVRDESLVGEQRRAIAP
jgi:hypothetical protein